MLLPKRIAVISRLVHPFATGGAEIHTYYIAKELAKRNNVFLISEGKYSIALGKNSLHLNIRKNVFPFFSSMLFILAALVLLLSRCKKVHILHAQVALSPAVIGIFAKMALRKPLVITCHGSEVRLQKNVFVKTVQMLAFSIANRITVVSKEIERILVLRYHVNPNKIDVIPNGYDEALLRNCLNCQNTCYSIVYVGRLSYPKDPLTLLRAFEENHKYFPEEHLYVVGDGELFASLKQFCVDHSLRQNVHFYGTLPHMQTLKMISSSNVFVLCSYEEGLPTSLIEAMALGKPCIATLVGGVAELVANGINGIVVPPGRPMQMAEALKRLSSNSGLRRELGEKAAESVKGLSWKKIAYKYEKIYQKLISSKN